MHVHYAGPLFDDNEKKAVQRVLDGGWLGPGKESRQFEAELASFIGTKYCHLTNSGSSASLLAFETLQLPFGSKVLTTACGFPTTLNPILQKNCVPVFIDMNLSTLNAEYPVIEAAAEKHAVSAIFLAHTLGNPNEMDRIMELARRKNIKVIEDNCDALGSKYKGKLTGSWGDISTLSMYPAHHITSGGEGGAIFTSDAKLSHVARTLRNWGRDCWCDEKWESSCRDRFGVKLNDGSPYDHKYLFSQVGYNLKMTEMQAAFGREQLKRLGFFIQKRNENFGRLYGYFKQWEEYLFLPAALPGSEPSWFAFPMTVKDGAPFSRADIQSYLEKKDIQTRVMFGGNLIQQPAYKNMKYEVFEGLKNTDKIAKDTFFLGVWPGLTLEQINYLFETMDGFFKKR